MAEILFLFHLDSERLERHDVDGIHVQWELDCLDNLREEIEGKGGVVLFRFGQILDSLNELHDRFNIHTVFGNEESGLQWSWNRDKLVVKWCDENDVKFEEFPSNGVIRRLRSRDDWKALRDRRIDSSLVEAPQRFRAPENVQSDVIPQVASAFASELGFEVRELQQRPQPGESAAMDTLFSFLDELSHATGWWIQKRHVKPTFWRGNVFTLVPIPEGVQVASAFARFSIIQNVNNVV